MKLFPIGILVSIVGCVAAVPAEGELRRKVPDGLVVLTFDDCNKSDRSLVAEVLKRHGFGATFYVTEGLGFLRNKENYVTWEEIVELDRMGFEIGNHTRTHPYMPGLSPGEMREELLHIDQRQRILIVKLRILRDISVFF